MNVQIFGADWGHGNKFVVAYRDRAGRERTRVEPAGLVEFIKTHSSCRIILESTFGSFAPEVRNQSIVEAASKGTVLLTASPRLTRSYRNAEKSDREDAKALLRMGENPGLHLAVPRSRSLATTVLQVELANGLRLGGWDAEGVAAFMVHLPSASDVPDAFHDVLLKPGGRTRPYNVSFVVPLIAAALDANTRNEFDRNVGANGHGYPSYIRSNFYHHRVRALSRLMPLKDSMRLARRATRWVYHVVKNPNG